MIRSDLSEYRAQRCTFHRVSLSLLYSLFFLFFLFFRRGVPLHAMRTLHYGLFKNDSKTRKYLSAPAERAPTNLAKLDIVSWHRPRVVFTFLLRVNSFARSNINRILRRNKTIYKSGFFFLLFFFFSLLHPLHDRHGLLISYVLSVCVPGICMNRIGFGIRMLMVGKGGLITEAVGRAFGND